MAIELDFVGVGTSRSGTTWLARVLREHPDLYLPPAKELHYFYDDEAYSPELEGLEAHFPAEKRGRLFGEYTPRYYLYHRALERIERAFPEVRILLSLRDPVERAFSQYRYFRFDKQKEYEPDFLRALEGHFHEDYVTKSRYYRPVQALYDLFEDEQILILYFRDIRDNPEAVKRKVYNFLGVSTDVEITELTRRQNPSSSHRDLTDLRRTLYSLRRRGRQITDRLGLTDLLEPPGRWIVSLVEALTPRAVSREESLSLDSETRATVYRRYFREDVRKLQRIVDRDLSVWVPGE